MFCKSDCYVDMTKVMAFATMDQKMTSGKSDRSNSTIVISSQTRHFQLQTKSCV